MKINNYKLFLESTKDIEYICHKYRISNYIIHSDGTVDVNGDVDLYNKKLTQLPVKFGKVTGYFTCNNNHLTSLEGSPHWVGDNFNSSYNNLTSLKGGPKYVGGGFSCTFNKLTTLEYGPETVIGEYYCYKNNLVNFKGFLEDYDLYVNFDGNPVNKLLIDIPRNKENKFIYWCNELNVIDDFGNVNEEWMEEVYHKLGLKYEN